METKVYKIYKELSLFLKAATVTKRIFPFSKSATSA